MLSPQKIIQHLHLLLQGGVFGLHLSEFHPVVETDTRDRRHEEDQKKEFEFVPKSSFCVIKKGHRYNLRSTGTQDPTTRRCTAPSLAPTQKLSRNIAKLTIFTPWLQSLEFCEGAKACLPYCSIFRGKDSKKSDPKVARVRFFYGMTSCTQRIDSVSVLLAGTPGCTKAGMKSM